MALVQDINSRQNDSFREDPSDSTKTVRKVIAINIDGTNIGQLLPTSTNNPSLTLEYTGDNLTKLIKTIDGTDYEKTLSYTGSNLTGVSEWTEV